MTASVPLMLAAILIVAVNVYGWRVIPDETRIPFRWLVLGTRETTSKKTGLVLWSLPEFLILGGLAIGDDPAMRWVGVGLLGFLLLLHFSSIRRMSRASRATAGSAD